MLKSVRLITILFLAVFMLACADDGSVRLGDTNNGDNGAGQGKPTKNPLKGKSYKRVLLMKYSKAIFYCNYWAQITTGEFDISKPPTRQVSWNLLKDFNTNKTYEIKHEEGGLKSEISIEVDVMKITSGRFTDHVGTTYKYAYSPTPTLNIDLDYVYSFDQDSSGSGARGYPRKFVLEKLNHRVFQVENRRQADNMGFIQRLSCSIDTTIKPKYIDQFKPIN